jgi:ClpP class serine protease
VPIAANAHMYAASQRWTPEQRERYKATLQRFYDGFVERVATGRNRPVAELEPHCRGRVWTGSQAKALGLVDEIGGLTEAIALAAQLAALDPRAYDVRHTTVQPPRSFVSRMLHNMWKRVSPMDARISRLAATLDAFGGDAAGIVLAHPEAPLAMLPYTLVGLR